MPVKWDGPFSALPLWHSSLETLFSEGRERNRAGPSQHRLDKRRGYGAAPGGVWRTTRKYTPPRLTGRSGNDPSTRLVQPAGVGSRPILLRREPPVELHDFKPDPAQVHNLAYDPDYRHVRRRLRDRLHQHQLLDI